MSLTRRVGLAFGLCLVAVLAAGVGATLWSARAAAEAGLHERSARGAATLARSLSALDGDAQAMARLLAAEFGHGGYAHLRFEASDGTVAFDRSAPPQPRAAPAWFASWLAPAAGRGMAQVALGERTMGVVVLDADPAAATDALWRCAEDALSIALGLGAAAAVLGWLAWRRVRAALAGALAQAQRLAAGRIVTAPEPADPELQLMTRAMNGMVERLKAAVELQVAQVEQLRRQAHFDLLTGLSNRRHFMAQLDAALQREDGAARCGLVLMRLRDLAGINLALGHATTDRMLCVLAQSMRSYAERVPGCFLGRLNGADFALCLPVGDVAFETAQTLATTMRTMLPTIGPGIAVAVGATDLRHRTTLARAMSDADEALAHAEARGAFAVELQPQHAGPRAGIGEGAWRQALQGALRDGRARLVGFVLLDAAGTLVHLESPMRLKLHHDGRFESAAQWLPLAVRTRMTGEIDCCAVGLALAEIARDGRPRGVNLAPASLAEPDFTARLRGLLFAAPRAARKLSLEMGEAAALERFAGLKELARQVRPCGVRFGLEHAGAHVGGVEHLFEDWLDFVKLDASLTQGVAADAARAEVVQATVKLLHGLAISVYAEAVAREADARTLWACGVDGITGPWATALHGAAER